MLDRYSVFICKGKRNGEGVGSSSQPSFAGALEFTRRAVHSAEGGGGADTCKRLPAVQIASEVQI